MSERGREIEAVTDHTQLRHAVGVLTEAEVAGILGKEVSTLQKMRSARIVAWLRKEASAHVATDWYGAFVHAADAIVRGEHAKEDGR